MVSIVLARLLAPEEFGLLAIITVFINLASVFLDFGFSTALIQKQDIREEHYSAVFFLNVTMGFLLAAAVFLIAPILGKFYEKEVLVNVTRLMSLSIFISSFGQVMRARLRRDMNFRPISLAAIYAAIISGAVAMLMAWKGFGVWSLAVQSVILQILTVLFLYLFCKLRVPYRFDRKALVEMWPFSSKLFFSGLLDTLFFNLDALIIGKLLSPTTLGYYHRAKSLENFGFRYTASTLSSVLFPGLSSIQNDTERFRQMTLKIFYLLSFISFIACGLFLVTSREIIIILFSAKWEPSVIMFQILISGAFASQIFNLFHNVLLSLGKSKTYLKINIFHKSLLFGSFFFIVYFPQAFSVYLVSFTFIRIVIYFLGLNIVSKQLKYGGLLFLSSVRDIIIYAITVTITLFLKGKMVIENLYLSLFVSSLIFLGMFLSACYIFDRTRFLLIIEETKILLKYRFKGM